MRKTSIVVVAVVVGSLAPSPASAWGFAAHRYLMRRAIEALPAELKPFFTHFQDELVMRVADPGLWRNAGWEDAPNHFVDFGVKEYGAYPFKELPREYGAAIEKFGMAPLRRNGVLPWREQEEFGNLRRAFESFAKGGAYPTTDTVLFAAVASHYIQDAHQPLHATSNFDGQLTGNQGVHARFERDLFERYQSRLAVNPAAPRPITNPRDAAFDALLAGYQLVDSLIKADKDAIGAKDTYDDEYFEKFFEAVKPMLERQLAASITATAGVIIGAWQLAGRPALGTVNERPLQKVQKVQKARNP